MENLNITTSFSVDADRNVYLHQKDPKNESIVIQTVKLQPTEVKMMIESLTDYPEYSDLMIKELEKRNLARSNHSI